MFDCPVPADRLIDEGVRLIEHYQKTGEWKERRRKSRQPVGMSQDQMMFSFGVAEGAIKAKTKGQYPAPMLALQAIRDGCNLPLEEGLKVEQKAVGELVGSPISANLIGIFFMQNRLSRDPGVADPNIKPKPIHHVGVLGTGLMGAGIATAHARSGLPTMMVDVDDQRIADGLARAQDVVMSRIKIGRATPMDMAKMLSLLSTSTSTHVFDDCDVVIEAVTENEAVKTEMYKKLSGVLRRKRRDLPQGATTSTISITRMAEAAPSPERFIGMHFFYPVDRMELVEVIRGEKTSDETVATIVAAGQKANSQDADRGEVNLRRSW